jgi:hypothetical protein
MDPFKNNLKTFLVPEPAFVRLPTKNRNERLLQVARFRAQQFDGTMGQWTNGRMDGWTTCCSMKKTVVLHLPHLLDFAGTNDIIVKKDEKARPAY